MDGSIEAGDLVEAQRPVEPSRVRVLLVTHELSLTGAPRLVYEALRVIGDAIAERLVLTHDRVRTNWHLAIAR